MASIQPVSGKTRLFRHHASLAAAAFVLAVQPSIRQVVAQGLRDLYRITDGVSNSHVEYHRMDVHQGGEVVLADLRGPGLVTYFYITDDSGGRLYPGLVLRVFWDGETEPSIHCPLSDFFGAFETKTIDYQSLPMQINHFCYMCYLPMPFSRQARFVLANDGDKDYSRPVAYGIDYEQDERFAREKSRLHCAWHRSNPTRDGMHPLLEVSGRGQYVGNFLQVYSRFNGWWGEGDTIFHIDGKTTTHTPGTEDEYGSCWGFGHGYAYVYSGYIQSEAGRNRMYRWYVANPVRCRKSLKVEIQNQRMDGKQTPSQDDYTSVAFCYQEEPHQPFGLAAYTQRVAASRAAEYPKGK
jgi:hypothetical protein